MSIYFLHFLSAFLPLSFFLAFFANKKNSFVLFSWVFVGIVFSYFGYFIAQAQTSGLKNLYLSTNILMIIVFLLSPIFFLKFNILNFIQYVLIFLISFVFGIKYFYISNGFTIFTQALIDNISVTNIFLILLGILFCIFIFFFIKWTKNIILNKTFFATLTIIFAVLSAIYALSEVLLILMQKGAINTETTLLSFVAKTLHYGLFYNYVFLFFAVLIAVFTILKKKKDIKKTGILDIKFRKNLTFNKIINSNAICVIFSVIIATSILLYYDLYASRPLQIDEPTLVEPNKNNEFVFDLEILKDNKLHRFAYLSDEGKVIRFFLLNRYKDKNSPVAVFDSCMICGDMGYVKKGDELICVACNVRIFLPSVGKQGGCNPIPFPYKITKDKLIIKFKDIMMGTNYFSEIREKKVLDPVSKKEIINLKAKFNYVYGDKTYFFESEENKNKFIQNPEIYVGKISSAFFRTQGYMEFN